MIVRYKLVILRQPCGLYIIIGSIRGDITGLTDSRDSSGNNKLAETILCRYCRGYCAEMCSNHGGGNSIFSRHCDQSSDIGSCD